MIILFMRNCILFFVYLTATAAAQNYIWPTNAEPYLSSSFCEYRPGHYHSGIDIKTWNREGYRCYAIADGFIEKIRVSPFGYGKVIYLRLSDGNIAVYAHLQRFTRKIDRMVRDLQMKKKAYSLTWFPKNLKVKRGEVIAYTGRTGIGVPHLHFEIRNRKEQPLNPLAYYHQIKDSIRPQLQQIAVIPFSPGTCVNDSLTPQVIDLIYIKNGHYKLKSPVMVRGQAGLAVRGFDQANGVPNTFAFYKTRMFVDDREVFQITYDLLDFEETSYIDAETYHPFWINERKVFHKLYIDPYNNLSSIKRYEDTDGTITISDAAKSFRILITDYHGNLSTIEGSIQPYIPDLDGITLIQQLDEWLYLKLSAVRVSSLHFYGSKDQTTWLPLENYEIMGRYSDNPGETILAKFQVEDSSQTFMKIEASHQTAVLPFNSFKGILPVSTRILGKQLILDFGKPCTGLQLSGRQASQTEKINRIVSSNNQTYLSANELKSGPLYLSLQADRDTIWHQQLEIGKLLPEAYQKFSWFDSTVIMESRGGGIFDTTLIEISRKPADSLKLNLPVNGDITEIQPGDIALLKEATVYLKAENLPRDKHWGVFMVNGDEMTYLSKDVRTEYFVVNTKVFGQFLVASDTIAPILNIRSPVSGHYYSKNPEIDFSLNDELSGIDGEEGISITVDSSFVLPEWDPEDELVRAVIDAPLDRGQHRLYVEVKDFLENVVCDTIQFYIK